LLCRDTYARQSSLPSRNIGAVPLPWRPKSGQPASRLGYGGRLRASRTGRPARLVWVGKQAPRSRPTDSRKGRISTAPTEARDTRASARRSESACLTARRDRVSSVAQLRISSTGTPALAQRQKPERRCGGLLVVPSGDAHRIRSRVPRGPQRPASGVALPWLRRLAPLPTVAKTSVATPSSLQRTSLNPPIDSGLGRLHDRPMVLAKATVPTPRAR
jgi:hypothetical protein